MIRKFLILFGIIAIYIASAALVASSSYAGERGIRAIERLNGMHERKHRRSLRRVLGVDPVRTPWCAVLVGVAVRKNGHKPPRGYYSAGSWRKWGRHVRRSNLRRGDVILRRSRYSRSGFHVGIVKSVSRRGVIACSGNTSNRIKCSRWKRIHSGRRG